jgi:hypothetical protein
MGLLGNWTTVDDTYVFQPGAVIRFYVEYGHIPSSAPSSDELKQALQVVQNFQVDSDNQTVLSVANVGQTQMVVIGHAMDSFSAGQLRGQIYNALSLLNSQRVSPLWNANVDDIQASDTRSILKQIGVDIPGDTSGQSSSGFPISTTLIVVAVAIAIVAIAFVTTKTESLVS